MKTQHTAGPWYVFPQHPDRFSIGAHRRGSLCICVGEAPPRRIVTGSGDDSIGEAEAAANTRLMATSPQLLELAHQYASECGECAGTRVMPDDEPCTECVFIWSVIDRAKGREC